MPEPAAIGSSLHPDMSVRKVLRSPPMSDLLVDQLRAMAQAFPDETGYRLLDTGDSITFAEWETQSNRLARGLVATGVAPGDRVSIYLPDTELLAWITAYPAIH